MMTESRTELAEKNLGLAYSCAARYTGRGIEYDDLVQAAFLGLVKAARGFDRDRGLRFSTYAVPVILGEIKQLFRQGGAVKLSRELQGLAIKAARHSECFEREQGRQPRVSELAAMLDISPEEAAQALCASQRPLSLTADNDDEDDTHQLDIAAGQFEGALLEKMALAQSVASLDERDRRLITERYVNMRTQSDTGRLLGMSQVQVSRREKAVLRMLREKMEPQEV